MTWQKPQRENVPEAPLNHFFVDEAGDLTLFGRYGRNLVGTEGVSKCFMVGMAHVLDVRKVTEQMGALHQRLLNDPYLKDIPSMRQEAHKTARYFHAKNDCPEIRMEMFRLLAQHEIKVQVGIRRKTALVKEARKRPLLESERHL